jgi:autotransporter-associated beta strand protein
MNSGAATLTGSGAFNASIASGRYIIMSGVMWAFSGTVNLGSSVGALYLNNGTTSNTGSTLATFDLGSGSATLANKLGANSTIDLGALKAAGSGTILSGNISTFATIYSFGALNTTTTFAGKIQDGTGGATATTAITKVGSGTLTLTNANTYTGATTISANGGILKVDTNTSTSTARLGSTSGITVNSGGTLLLANSGGSTSTDRINNSATIALSGTFNTGGLNEGPVNGVSGASAAMGVLTLSPNSTIDFSTGNTAQGSNLLFAGLNSTIGTNISIRNWTGTLGADTGSASNDRLLFTTNPALSDAQLASIRFYDDIGNAVGSGATAISFNGYTEIVPVPEPTTIFGALALVGVIGYRERRRWSVLFVRPRRSARA